MRIQKQLVPKSDWKKVKVLRKTIKYAQNQRRLNLLFEEKMLRMAKSAVKTHNLNLYIAKNLQSIVKQIKKSQD